MESDIENILTVWKLALCKIFLLHKEVILKNYILSIILHTITHNVKDNQDNAGVATGQVSGCSWVAQSEDLNHIKHVTMMELEKIC